MDFARIKTLPVSIILVYSFPMTFFERPDIKTRWQEATASWN
jgi:hypothetical protein